MGGFTSHGLAQTQDDPTIPRLLSLRNCVWEASSIVRQVTTDTLQVRGDGIPQQMEQLGKVINQVTKFVQERISFPLGEQMHEFILGGQVWMEDWKHDSLAPPVERSLCCCFNHPYRS